MCISSTFKDYNGITIQLQIQLRVSMNIIMLSSLISLILHSVMYVIKIWILFRQQIQFLVIFVLNVALLLSKRKIIGNLIKAESNINFFLKIVNSLENCQSLKIKNNLLLLLNGVSKQAKNNWQFNYAENKCVVFLNSCKKYHSKLKLDLTNFSR